MKSLFHPASVDRRLERTASDKSLRETEAGRRRHKAGLAEDRKEKKKSSCRYGRGMATPSTEGDILATGKNALAVRFRFQLTRTKKSSAGVIASENRFVRTSRQSLNQKYYKFRVPNRFFTRIYRRNGTNGAGCPSVPPCIIEKKRKRLKHAGEHMNI